MKNPLVSIIIPCYNGAKFISKTLESVCSQTYKNWEAIVVNDGSTDDSAEVLNKWKERDTKILIVKQENQGLSSARNSGIKIAKGDFIYFLDADDLIASEAIEDLVSYAKKYKTTDIVFGKTATTNGHNFKITGYLDHGLSTGIAIPNQNKELLIHVIEKPMICTAHNNLYKTSFIKKNSLKFKKRLLHEDELWFFETLFYAEYITLNQKVTYFYNIGNDLSITKNFKKKNLLAYCDIVETIYDKYYLNPEFKSHKEIISIYLDNMKIKIIGYCYKQISPREKREVNNVILNLFLKIKNKRNENVLNSKIEAIHKNFKIVNKIHPKLQLKSLRYSQSNRLIRKVKNYFILNYAKIKNLS